MGLVMLRDIGVLEYSILNSLNLSLDFHVDFIYFSYSELSLLITKYN